MPHAEIACTCGHAFTVSDDGNGAPHACPKCHVMNVLPRRRDSGLRLDNSALGRTDVRSTNVLNPVTAAHQTAVMGLPAGSQLGAYRIVRRVGKGGMGSVYEAVDERSSQRVALKVLSPDLAAQPDFVARFHRESRSLSSFGNARIAKVYFSGAAEGVPFFAMEFVDGKNLEELLERDGRPDTKKAIEWMREIARGLRAAAEHGLIHRDVKPTNILIDQEGRVKIVDFGLAKSLNSTTRLTVTGVVVGTPFYLSPEQGLGKVVDQRSDIYSLGATFYHLLTGKPPYEADNSVSVILKHVNDAPTPIRDRAPEVSEALARIVMRCLAKDPRHRYQDYDELLHDLEAAERGDPVAAPSESATIRKAPTFVVVDDLEEGSTVLKRASMFRRFLALTFDVLLIALLAVMLRGLRFGEFPMILLLAPFVVLYFGIGDALGGQTLGKSFFQLRVAKPDGGSVGLLRGIARMLLHVPLALAPLAARLEYFPSRDPNNEIGPILDALADWGISRQEFGLGVRVLLVIAAVDILLCLLSPRNLSLHDTLSGTSVFREERVKRRKRRPLKEEPMHPTVVIFASIVPGLGQLLNGEFGKGLVFFIAIALTAGLMPIAIGVWGLAAFEAHRTATQRRDRWRSDHAG